MRTQVTTFMNDEALVLSFQMGEADAAAVLYNRYFKKVYHKCLSFTKNPEEAADLAQDVFVKVMDNLSTFKGHSKFSTWLYAITYNYCTDHFRKLRNVHFTDISEDFELCASETASNDMVAKDIEETKVIELMEELNQDDKNMLIQKYQMNSSIKDLEKTYNLSSSAIKMRLSRAKAKVVSLYQLTTMSPAA